MTIEKKLLDVYPEADEFVKYLSDRDDLSRARVADKNNPPNSFLSYMLPYKLSDGERIWCIAYNADEIIGDKPIRSFGKPTGKVGRDSIFFNPNDPRIFAEMGIRLDRMNPLIYIGTIYLNHWSIRGLNKENGFNQEKVGEYFRNLQALYNVVFGKKALPGELEFGAYKNLKLD